ncbi:hypothetical protein [Mariniphaga sp.]|uniref:hypothetical protein n=1 Tax=Mariniphaga sp. TaxID=1954475 RepID=UPI0035637FE8
MFKIIFIFLVFIGLVSCGTQQQLKKSFTGKPSSVLEPRFGQPVTIIETAGDSVYIFENTEELGSTEINQGRLALDPMVSPKVNKTERFYFTVKNGLIIKTRFEEEYER